MADYYDMKDKIRYYDMKDKIRREGMAEQKSKFLEMAGSKGLPSRAAGQPKAVIAGLEEKSLPPAKEYGETAAAWMGSPAKELKQGTGGYVYEYDPSDDSYTIVKTKGGKALAKPIKVTKDSHPDAFVAIKDDTANVSKMQLEGKWDVEKNAPLAGASPVYAGRPAVKKAPAAAAKKSAPKPAATTKAAAQAPAVPATAAPKAPVVTAKPAPAPAPVSAPAPKKKPSFGEQVSNLAEDVSRQTDMFGGAGSKLSPVTADWGTRKWVHEQVANIPELWQGYRQTEQLRATQHDAFESLKAKNVREDVARRFVADVVQAAASPKEAMVTLNAIAYSPPSRK